MAERRRGRLADFRQRPLLQKAERLLLGSEEELKRKYGGRLEPRERDRILWDLKRRNARLYLAAAGIFLLLLFAWVLSSGSAATGDRWDEEGLASLKRPDPGSESRYIPLSVEVQQGEISWKGSLPLTLSPRSISDAEKKKRLEQYADSLTWRILGENEDLSRIRFPLSLISLDEEENIGLYWESTEPELLDERGKLHYENIRGGETIGLKVLLRLDGEETERIFSLQLAADAGAPGDRRQLMQILGSSLASAESVGREQAFLSLPKEMGSDTYLRWEKEKDARGGLLLGGFLLAMLWIRFQRYDSVERSLKKRAAAIARDYPDMVDRFLLLLNAGLVVPAALLQTAEKGGLIRDGREHPLFEDMARMALKTEESNSSMLQQLRDYASRCGVQELMRFVAVVSENVSRGSSLARKLEAENALLWLARKKRAEEQGRLADSRLTFPLVILLSVLIVVTVAPALLGM